MKTVEEKGENVCYLFVLCGKCKYGEKCRFLYDFVVCEVWKNVNLVGIFRGVLEEEGVDEEMNVVVLVELVEYLDEEWDEKF